MLARYKKLEAEGLAKPFDEDGEEELLLRIFRRIRKPQNRQKLLEMAEAIKEADA